MQPSRADLERWAISFRCFGDPTRLAILHHVAGARRPVAVHEIVDRLGTAQSTVSHHLAILIEARVLRRERHGNRSRFSVDGDALAGLPSPAELLGGWLAPAQPPAAAPAEVTPPSRRPGRVTPVPRPGPAPYSRLAVCNQKGGSGKTTTVVNLGAAAAELGCRVLVVDLDPQGNATSGLGLARGEPSAADVLAGRVMLEECVEPTRVRNLFVVPAGPTPAMAEDEAPALPTARARLRDATEQMATAFDLVLLDCPPSLGLRTLAAMAAAGGVLIPTQCEYYALEGLAQMVQAVRLTAGPRARPRLAIVLTMHDGRTALSDQVVAEVRSHFGDAVYDTVIPRTVRLAEASSFGEPIVTFDPASRGATAYRSLAGEIVARPEAPS